MIEDGNRSGVEVPESDWNEQLIDVATQFDAEGHDVVAPTEVVIREADPTDVAEQDIVVVFDDDDGYDDSAPL